jgi:elongation factor P hydroxylase
MKGDINQISSTINSPELDLFHQNDSTEFKSVDVLISLFNQLFYKSTHTKLIKGENEPIYLPMNDECAYNRIVFAHGFYSSALHEISHWCLAGAKRRTLVDFGYWYVPDGRTESQQKEFEQVEVKPQALEWLFSIASGIRFNVSFDNLSGSEGVDTVRESRFKDNVYQQAIDFFENGLPDRAGIFIEALLERYNRKEYWRLDQLNRHDI